MAAIKGVIHDQGATATDKGGMVFNVRAYGALGGANPDNVDDRDDTPAFKAAIAAAASQVTGVSASETAGSGNGGVVFVPQGIYRIKDTLNVPQGVSIRGAGMYTSQILFSMSVWQDGLVWSTPNEGDFGQGGFLEDIDIKAEKYTDGMGAQSLVVLRHWTTFAINRVRIIGASAYNLGILDCVNISVFHLLGRSAIQRCLWIGASSGTVTTTCRFVGCYFQNTLRGPCVDVAGLGIAFDGCIFESAGSEIATHGYGAQVRGGTVTFNAPYFEANRSWDLLAGTDVVAANSSLSPSVTVINPVIMPLHDKVTGELIKVANTGGLKFERGGAFVLGGNLYHSPRPLVFSKQMDLVQTATFGPNLPAVEGGTFANVPGTILYKNAGQAVQAGDLLDNTNP